MSDDNIATWYELKPKEKRLYEELMDKVPMAIRKRLDNSGDKELIKLFSHYHSLVLLGMACKAGGLTLDTGLPAFRRVLGGAKRALVLLNASDQEESESTGNNNGSKPVRISQSESEKLLAELPGEYVEKAQQFVSAFPILGELARDAIIRGVMVVLDHWEEIYAAANAPDNFTEISGNDEEVHQ